MSRTPTLPAGRARAAALAAAATLALGAGAAGACSKDPAGHAATTTPATSTTAPPGPPVLAWTVTGLEPNGTQPPGPDVVAAVKTTLDAYLAGAVVGPLYTGTPAGDLTGVFSAAALDRIASDPAARATLLDEGLPAATTSITATAAKAALSSVAGPDGATAVVTASLDLTVRAIGPAGAIDIVRSGEVVLVPEPAGWRIDSFTVTTRRDSRP